jgi:hypothetical protein
MVMLHFFLFEIFFGSKHTTRFNSFIDIIFFWYLYSQSVSKYVTNELTNENSPSEKLLLVISGMSMSPSVINLLMDLKMDKARQKNLPASFHQYFSREVCHITNGNQWNTVCNFVSVFICPLIYPSVNITYHRHNIICNFIVELTVVMTFAVILFQLSGIYWQMWFVGNPVSNILFF